MYMCCFANYLPVFAVLQKVLFESHVQLCERQRLRFLLYFGKFNHINGSRFRRSQRLRRDRDSFVLGKLSNLSANKSTHKQLPCTHYIQQILQ